MPLTQKSQGISDFHLWTKALSTSGFVQLVLNDHSEDRRLQWPGAIRDSIAEPTRLGQGRGRNRPCEYGVDVGKSTACLSEVLHSLVV